MSKGFFLDTVDAFKARYKLFMPNIISPLRANRRFRWWIDEEIKLTSYAALDAEFKKDIKEGEEKGDLKELDKGVDKFVKYIRKLIKKDDSACYGAVWGIGDRIDKLKKESHRIMTKLEQLTREKGSALSKEEARKLEADVKNTFTKMFQTIYQTLDEIRRQDLLISRNRTQFRAVMWAIDASMKSDLSFFYDRLKVLDKKEEKEEKALGKIEDSKYIRKVGEKKFEDEVRKELLVIRDEITAEMQLFLKEARILVHITLEFQKEIGELIEKELRQELMERKKLPPETEKKLEIKIAQLIKDIENNAEQEMAIDKAIMAKAA